LVISIHCRFSRRRSAKRVWGFYLFPEKLRSELKRTTERLSAQALDADGVEAIVFFARSIEKWEMPYEAVLYAKKR
jgi:hypothetical protein